MSEIVDVELYIETLKEQRNKAVEATAIAVTRSTMFQRENEKLREELQRAQARVAELERQVQPS